jgi:hypothetical protein
VRTEGKAAVLARHSYGTLLLDTRGHGLSGGHVMDFGWWGGPGCHRLGGPCRGPGCCLAHASEVLVTSTLQMLVLGFADRAAAASKAFLNGGTCSR